MTSAATTSELLVSPGRSAGLVDVVRWRFLLKLLVRKELRVRYRGSVLGLLWSYVKPGVQLLVFYVAMGKFLGLERTLPNFVIYLFAGIVVVNFFGEVFGNTTRSIVANSDLVKKIYLPRELFPVSSVWVAIVHLVPQSLVLVLAALAAGWRPGVTNIAGAVGALAIAGLFALGLGLVFGAVNVLFRDAENIVDLVLMMATWLSPVLYTFSQVSDTVAKDGLPRWLLTAYQANPLTAAVELAHYGFWVPTNGVAQAFPSGQTMPDNFAAWGLVGLVASLLSIVVGQLVFRRLEGRFAQEL
jgi:ABC-2 type transport system permease protein